MSKAEIEQARPITVRFGTAGDERDGRFYPSEQEKAHATVLLLDGFPGSETDLLRLSEWLPRMGFHVFTFHWRGVFGSEGVYSLANALADVETAVAYLHSDALPEGVMVDPGRLAVGGWSHGGGLALVYAAAHPEIHHVFTVGGANIGEFVRQLQSDAAHRATVTEAYEALAHPAGPVRFAGDPPIADLLENGAQYALQPLAAALADRHLLFVGGWNDAHVPVETHLLPLYRRLQDAGAAQVTVKVLTSDHFFNGRHFTLARTVQRWLLHTLPAPDAPGRDAAVSLREIERETARRIINLKVTDEQRQFVASNEISIAQAYFDREHAWFRAIYADETPVGFVMLFDDPEQPVYYLWRFMIDVRYQGMGYGRRAMEALIAHVKTRPNAKELLVSCVPGEGSPCPFYKQLGFEETGEMEGIEVVMALPLHPV